MKLLTYPLLTDENIHPGVVAWLRQAGCDVRTVFDEALNPRSDVDILRRAHASHRLVLTHDSDFGQIALRTGEPIIASSIFAPATVTRWSRSTLFEPCKKAR